MEKIISENMEKAEFYYVISEGTNSSKLARGLKELLSILESCEKPRIKTYENESDAKKYIQAELELSGKVSKEVNHKSASFPEGIKKIKSSETNEENKVLNPIYSYFREDKKQVALASYHINKDKVYLLYFDGASKENPGNAGAGYAIYTSIKDKVYSNFMNLGIKTNNQAEYSGILYGMKSALNLGIKKLDVYGDSQLVINQMTGKYKVNNVGLKPYNEEAKELAKKFQHITFNWVRREENSEADELSNQGVAARSN